METGCILVRLRECQDFGFVVEPAHEYDARGLARGSETVTNGDCRIAAEIRNWEVIAEWAGWRRRRGRAAANRSRAAIVDVRRDVDIELSDRLGELAHHDVTHALGLEELDCRNETTQLESTGL